MEYSYDSYPSTLASDGLSFSAVPDVVNESSSSVKGLKTSEKVRVLQSSEMDSALSEDSSATFVTRAFYYDNIGRLVQTVEKSHLGQVSRISVEYTLDQQHRLYSHQYLESQALHILSVKAYSSTKEIS